MQLKDLKTKKGTKSKRVGRGGSRGKTSGKGTKGQTSRSGNSTRPAERDMIKKIPKLRGRGKNKFASIKVKPAFLNISLLEKSFKENEEVNPRTIVEKGLISKSSGKIPAIKLLGNGDLKMKLLVSDCQISKIAKEKIEKAGGRVSQQVKEDSKPEVEKKK